MINAARPPRISYSTTYTVPQFLVLLQAEDGGTFICTHHEQALWLPPLVPFQIAAILGVVSINRKKNLLRPTFPSSMRHNSPKAQRHLPRYTEVRDLKFVPKVQNQRLAK